MTTIVEEVAQLLCQPQVSEDKDFFWNLTKGCELLGYKLCAEQRGIQGTYIYMRKNE